jgi:gliding motility-associated protein GldM
MAGGKETPRQKMIGMMYLVLTALLALNVSKSILDAFVAIEENTQKSAIVQLDRGNIFVSDLKSGILQNKKENPGKAAKCQYYLDLIAKIDVETANMIKFIDEIKIDIMKKSGEAVDTEKNQDKETIVWKKYSATDKLRPSRLNLMAVQAKDQYDVPMHEIIGEEINNPAADKVGMKLWKMYNGFRASVVETLGTYHDKIDSVSGKGMGAPKFVVKTSPINKYKDNKDLDAQVNAMLDKTQCNKEDRGVLKQLYMELTKEERFEEVNDVKNVHWIGKTFDHSPLVAALASLTAMQLEVLNARATAAGYLASKVVTAEFSFNKLIALATATPSVASPGDPIEISVVMGAYDSDNQPTVTGGSFTVANGMGVMKTTAGSADMTFSGTIAIKSRSGAVKEEKWETKVGVLTSEKEASIETPEMQVFYEGIPIELKASATGMYKNVRMSVASPYTAAAGSAGSTVTVSLSGTDSKGSSVSLGSKKFTVKKAPKPELTWNGIADGGRAMKAGGSLSCAYGNNVPFSPTKGRFSVVNYSITVSGLKGTLDGNGSTISAAHLNALKAVSGGKIAVQVRFAGTSTGYLSATFSN